MTRSGVKALVVSLATVGFVALTGHIARADDGYFRGYVDDARFHDVLEHRAFHRELAHREAHRYPMTWYQHERLHDWLDHEAFHDDLAHRNYHRSQYVPRSYYGLPGPTAYINYYQPYGSRIGYTLPRRRVVYYFSN